MKTELPAAVAAWALTSRSKCGRNFYIAIGAAAALPLPSTPETDFHAKDFGNSNATVSTAFRDIPGFGVPIRSCTVA